MPGSQIATTDLKIIELWLNGCGIATTDPKIMELWLNNIPNLNKTKTDSPGDESAILHASISSVTSIDFICTAVRIVHTDHPYNRKKNPSN